MVNQWYGLYSEKWGNNIVKSSSEHPAKFAKGLIYKIIRHGLDNGYWQYGSIIFDPYAGVGTGGVACATSRLRWLGVELNIRFVNIAIQNFALYDKELSYPEYYKPKIIHGNSLFLEELILDEKVDAIITSPPYGNRVDDHGKDQKGYEGSGEKLGKYGSDEWQIGNVRLGTEYWMLTDRVLDQISRFLLKSNGIIVLVLKAFIKGKRIINLPQLTYEHLVKQGYKFVERIDAMLIDQNQQQDMFNDNPIIKAHVGQFAWSYWHRWGLLVDREVILVFRNNQ